MMSAITGRIVRTGQRLGCPDILFWSMPWLMILLVMGTVAQRNMGLYDTQRIYFSSFFFSWRGLFLPGGYLVIAVMALNLVCKFIFSSVWTWDKAGIHLTHLAVIILLSGGLLTALSMEEGYIALKKNEQKSYVTDYQDRVLRIEDSQGNIITVDFDDLQKDQAIENLPFMVTPLRLCRHSHIVPIPDDGKFDIKCTSPLKDSEQNIAGMVYRIDNAVDAQNGIYTTFENRQGNDDIISRDGNIYKLIIHRRERLLPFAIELQSFNRPVYAGTDMARDYQSRIVIHDGAVNWPALITMNEPLRYKGYTLYQASTWMDEDGEAVSVLSVVTNRGWIFPYIAGILLMIGLLYHLIIRLRMRR